MRGGMIDRLLPQVVRNELVHYVHAYRYREEIGAAFATRPRRIFGSVCTAGSPGGTRRAPRCAGTSRYGSALGLRSRGTCPRRTCGDYVDSCCGLLGSGRWSARSAQLGAILTRCREAGVPLALFEVPTAPILREHLPKGAYRRYRVAVARAAQAHGVPFLSVEDLGLELTRRDFREQSHLNQRGATKLTRAVAERVVLPALNLGSNS